MARISTMLQKIFMLLICVFYLFPTTTYAFKVAPRITDREIVEKLTRLEAGQAAINQRIDDLSNQLNQRIDDLNNQLNQRINDVSNRLNQRIDDVNKRIDDLDKKLTRRIDDTNQRISDLYDITLTMFAILAALMGALFGYIIWDRRTMMKPVQERLERLEKDIERDLELRNEHGSIPARLLNVLRELAKTDAKLAAVLRSFSLL